MSKKLHKPMDDDEVQLYPQISKKLISSINIASARNKVLKELDCLRDDYFPYMSRSDFLIKHIYSDSRMIHILQARCFFLGLINDLVSDDLLKFIWKHLSDFTLFGVGFLRIHHPDALSNSKERKDNVTSSPLHYDRYECLGKYVYDTRTTWIPLQDIDETTGSLCYTTNSELIEMTGDGFSSHDLHGDQTDLSPSSSIIEFWEPDFKTKISTKKDYIKLLKKHVLTIKCKEGEVVIFDKNILHGGSYSLSKMRISVDIRWVDRRYPGTISENLESFKIKSISDLYYLNDFKFIFRKTIKLKYIAKHPRAIIIVLAKKFSFIDKTIQLIKKS